MKVPKIRNFDKYIIDENSYKTTYKDFLNYLEGHNDKTFVLCESEFFKELFDEIRNNPNSSYVTYLNDFIKENYDGEKMPISQISCFKKSGENNIIEELVSKLANSLSIPTTYIKNMPRNNHEFKDALDKLIATGKPGSTIVMPTDYLLSVDFIGKDEHFDTIDAYCEKSDNTRVCERGASLSNWYGIFDHKKLKNPITKEELSHDEKMSLFREFIPQYFFRTALIRDWDFMSENVGIIYNSMTGEYRIAPMFDFEFAYYRMRSRELYDRLSEDLIFGYDCFPKETTEIINKFIEFNMNEFLSNLILDCVTTSRTKSLNDTLVKCAYEDFLLVVQEFEDLPDVEQ